MRYLLLTLSLFSALALQRPAHADVLYTIDAVGVGAPGTPPFGIYTFSEPSILTVPTNIPVQQLLSSSGAPLNLLFVNPIGGFCFGTGSSIFQSCIAIDTDDSGLIYGFSQPLLTFGTYGDPGPHGLTLTISPTSSPVPEPSSLPFVGTAIFILAFRFCIEMRGSAKYGVRNLRCAYPALRVGLRARLGGYEEIIRSHEDRQTQLGRNCVPPEASY